MQVARRRFSRYWLLAGVVMLVFLAAYGVAEALRVPFLTDTLTLTRASLATALLTISLLTADTVLPVPSSLVMVANGTLFGFWTGSIVSLIGNIGGFLFAYWLGYRSSPLIQKAVSPGEVERGNRVVQKWGVLALIFTRPLPILAETTAIMAGVARMPFGRSLIAVTIASLPISMVYAWAGARTKGFNGTVIIFLALVVLAGIAWAIDRRIARRE